MKSSLHYTIVGISIVVLTIFLVAGFFWLSVHRNDINYKTYIVYMTQEVSGLGEQSQVRFNGVAVGYVKDISLDLDNPQLVKLTLTVDENTPISTSTMATLKSQGITGVDYVSLQSQTMDAPPLLAHPGESFPVIQSKPSWVMQVSEVLPSIADKIAALSDNINNVFGKKNEDSIAQSLQNIQSFTKNLSSGTHSLDVTMNDLHQAIINIDKVSASLPAVVSQLQKTLRSINATANKVGVMSGSVKHAFASSQQMVNHLSAQVMPSVQQMLRSLNNSAVNLQGLTQKLSQNPSILVRGSQQQSPGPGEGAR